MEWVNPAESRACRNSRTVPIGQLTGSSWWSPHHEIKVSTSRRTVSSLRELWIGGWSQQPRLRDRKLWVAPPQGPPPQLPHLRAGVIDPCLWEEIPPDENLPWRTVEERNQVREPYSADQNGATSSSRTPSRRTLSRTPGSRAIGGKPYRRSLGQVCTMAFSPSGTGWIREYQRDIVLLLSSEEVHLCLAKHSPDLLHHLGVKHPFPGPRPLPRQDVCSHIEMPRNVNCSQREEFVLGPRKDLCTQACTGGVNADLLGGWCKRPPLCCRCAPTLGDLLGLGGSVSVLETRPTSPANWCATWDGDHSTDRGQGGHLHDRSPTGEGRVRR